jgi:hypothetical protein
MQSKKNYFIDSLNKLENKSNIINQDFSIFSNESHDLGNKLFNRTYKTKEKEELNVKEINEYFNLDKGFEKDIESLLKNNAKKVKKIMDSKCGKILDKIVKKICLEEIKLNKNHFLSFRNDKIFDKKNSMLKKYNKEFKNEKKNNIFDMFKKKDEDFFDIIKSGASMVSVVVNITQSQTNSKKRERQDPGAFGKKITAARSAEQRICRACAERSPHACALALVSKDKRHKENRYYEKEHQKYRISQCHRRIVPLTLSFNAGYSNRDLQLDKHFLKFFYFCRRNG